MGGIGGKGKGARRRQKLKENAKVFDKKTGSFREPKIELIDGQVSREELLKAPSSFRRFMEATRRAKEMRDRRDERARVARGSEGSDDKCGDEGGDVAAAERNKDGERGTRDDAAAGGESDTDDEATHTWLRPDQGDGGAGVADDVAFEEAAHKKQPKKKKTDAVAADAKNAKDVDGEDDAEGRKGKRKYKSLRERKSEARKAAKAAREEEDAFIGVVSGARTGDRADPPSFGETADAPPTITLKRKSGGKGAKAVPVAESGHKIAGSKGTGNRQARIFANLMASASDSAGTAAEGRVAPAVGLRRAAEIEALRERAISEYRKMRGRPMNNGRNSSLASDPSRLFSSVGGVNVRKDAGRD